MRRLDGAFDDIAEAYGYTKEDLRNFVDIATTVYVDFHAKFCSASQVDVEWIGRRYGYPPTTFYTGSATYADIEWFGRRYGYTTRDDLRNFVDIATTTARMIVSQSHNKTETP